MSPRIRALEEASALTHHFSTYIDVTVVNSALAAMFILVGAVWALHAFNRLWQGSLLEDAADGIAAAQAAGLELLPTGWGPRLVAQGDVDGQPVQLEWCGGVFGARSVIRQGGRRRTVPLVADAPALGALLSD